MNLGKYHIELMAHCVGLDHRKPYARHGELFFRPNRNYFDCGHADEPFWRDIAACGYAVDWNGRGWYKLTRSGFAYLSAVTGVHIHCDLAVEAAPC